MPRPMTKQAFRERLHEMRDAVGLPKFSAPPAQQPGIEAVDPVDLHNLMDLVEQIVRRQRELREEVPSPAPRALREEAPAVEAHTLDELVGGITPKNLHGET